jgi:pyocin large subunit-like protein
VWIAAAAAGLLALAACDKGPASIPARDHASASATSAQSGGSDANGDSATPDTHVASRDDARDAPVPMVNGKPMWAANRRHTAEENARYQFGRDGADFGARNVDDFVAKAHAFVESPPRGTETLTRRNGDKLLYDAHANVFAVVSRDGAPRTMFKPRDGQAYWAEQKQRLAEEANGDQGGDGGGRHYGYRSHRDDDDQG